jgi:hypothetical protein
LMHVSPKVLNFIGSAIGKSAELNRFAGSLEVDPSKAKRVLNWKSGAEFSLELHAMVQAYLGVPSDH